MSNENRLVIVPRARARCTASSRAFGLSIEAGPSGLAELRARLALKIPLLSEAGLQRLERFLREEGV